MRNHVAERDPGRNPYFSRHWTDDPLALPDLRHLDHEVAPQVVEDVGRRAIGRWLDKASRTHGTVAAEAFRKANSIRLKMGLEWEDLVGQRAAA